MKIKNLKVCGLTKLLGVDIQPVFSWVIESYELSKSQTAYQIIVTDYKEIVWDSGKILSDQNYDINYTGINLSSKTTYRWSVTVWDESNMVYQSDQAIFSTGMLNENDWKGQWISAKMMGSSRAAVRLRKVFNINKQVKEGYVYICGLGFFDLLLNGNPPDDSVLNPFYTQYEKTVLYRTFNVTDLLKSGENVISIELGNSFYNEAIHMWFWKDAAWRDTPKLLCNILINYDDGECETIVTDTSWKASTEGPTYYNSVFYGEKYDARCEQHGWDLSGFNDSDWQTAVTANSPTGILKSQLKVPIRRIAQFKPECIKKSGKSYIITAPQNVSGWILLTGINQPAGSEITIRYAQTLEPDGSLKKWGAPDGALSDWYPDGYLQQDVYIANGSGNESFEPKYSCKGFRHIQIEGINNLSYDNITIYRISNNVEEISSFNCGNQLLNKLHRMMIHSIEDNFHGEHCDPMLEKSGWLGDVNVSLDTMMYNCDMPATFPPFLDTMRDCFDLYGMLPIMVPTANWGVHNWIVWNSVYVYGIASLDKYFGTHTITATHYDSMKRFTHTHIEIAKNNDNVCLDDQLADWVCPMGGSDPNVPYNENPSEGCGIAGTAYLYGMLYLMADFADRLNKPSDAAEYREFMEEVYNAFNRKFFNLEQGIYETTVWNQIGTRTRYRQTSNLLPLAFNLVPNEHKNTVVANLVNDIKQKHYHLDTGCVGTKFILPVLCDCGYPDVAYKIITNTTYPGWGLMAENNISTGLWEMWESTARSFDHYFLGTYDEWFFSHLAGITDIKEGYKSFSIRPFIIRELGYVKATIHTVRGIVSSEWSVIGDNIKLLVTIPVGSTASVYLEGKEYLNIKTGSFEFTAELNKV